MSRTQLRKSTKSIPLSDVVRIPPKAYPSTNITGDNITTLTNYLPSASTLEIIKQFSAGLRGSKSGRMLSITGPYGSGKSTMATFLIGLLAAKKSKEWKTAFNILQRESEYHQGTLVRARKTASMHDRGAIRCIATARREPVAATLFKALDAGISEYFGKYTAKSFTTATLMRKCLQELKKGIIPDTEHVIAIVENIAKIAPVVFVIDEFGKNIEYFVASDTQESDLFLLQELAEKSGRANGTRLSIVTLQHMAFEEYAVGASIAQKQEWSKIQGRFEDIPFANSPEQTRILVSETIMRPKKGHTRSLNNWAKKEAKAIEALGIIADSELVASCYPLDPLALEILPELCSRYGQRERTLLSFLSDARKHTVSTFIDENNWNASNPPVMRIDSLYDYFISGTAMIYSSSMNVSRLMEIETIIRDAHGLSDPEKMTLKAIGVLNLIGRSGYLRASSSMIDYAVGEGSKQVLKELEKRSIVTYREHADEYRIWHGTDIDIAAKIAAYRSRYKRTPLFSLLAESMQLVPVVAAKHSMRTGTMRLFERRLELKQNFVLDENYDGVVFYITDPSKQIPQISKPVITARPEDTSAIRLAAIEVCAIRDILESDDIVISDRVARQELEERLEYSRITLGRRFADSYGEKAQWRYGKIPLKGKPSALVSDICDKAYNKTPTIRNEMINRTTLSQQGSSAKRRLLEAMITNPAKHLFGIGGYGPDRAVCEAILLQNRIHVPASDGKWKMADPKSGTAAPVWNAMLDAIKKAKGRIVLSKVYDIVKKPPYGVKDGPLQILAVAMMIAHKHEIALYEHGTFVPKIKPEIAERMTKNPDYFELKYFHATKTKTALLQAVSRDLGVSSASVIDVVGELVNTILALPSHMKTTKRLDKHAIAVRDAIIIAREPDTLLFESLPQALGFGTNIKNVDISKFSKILAKSTVILREGFLNMIEDIENMLFQATGMTSRTKLSETAKLMTKNVTDNQMKNFLHAVSADSMDHTEDWINYIAMNLTGIPPREWTDMNRELLENNLKSISFQFHRLAGINFSKVSKGFADSAYHVTITHPDGTEQYCILPINPKNQKIISSIANKLIKDMKNAGMSSTYINAIATILKFKI